MLKCCLTSTETVGLLGTGAQDGHLDFHTAPEPLNSLLVCNGYTPLSKLQALVYDILWRKVPESGVRSVVVEKTKPLREVPMGQILR